MQVTKIVLNILSISLLLLYFPNCILEIVDKTTILAKDQNEDSSDSSDESDNTSQESWCEEGCEESLGDLSEAELQSDSSDDENNADGENNEFDAREDDSEDSSIENTREDNDSEGNNRSSRDEENNIVSRQIGEEQSRDGNDIDRDGDKEQDFIGRDADGDSDSRDRDGDNYPDSRDNNPALQNEGRKTSESTETRRDSKTSPYFESITIKKNYELNSKINVGISAIACVDTSNNNKIETIDILNLIEEKNVLYNTFLPNGCLEKSGTFTVNKNYEGVIYISATDSEKKEIMSKTAY